MKKWTRPRVSLKLSWEISQLMGLWSLKMKGRLTAKRRKKTLNLRGSTNMEPKTSDNAFMSMVTSERMLWFTSQNPHSKRRNRSSILICPLLPRKLRAPTKGLKKSLSPLGNKHPSFKQASQVSQSKSFIPLSIMPRKKLPTCSASATKPSQDKNEKNWKVTLNKSGFSKKSWAARNPQQKIRPLIRTFPNKVQPSVKTKNDQARTPQARRHQQALLKKTQPKNKNKIRSWCSN